MDRKDFIKRACALAGIVMIPAGIMDSCKKQGNYSGPTNVDFTVDITASANASLNTVGGALLVNGIIIVRTGTSVFDALSATCTHEGCTVGYNSSRNDIVCPCHGGTYDVVTGAVLSGPPPSPLTKYTATLTGNILTVKS